MEIRISLYIERFKGNAAIKYRKTNSNKCKKTIRFQFFRGNFLIYYNNNFFFLKESEISDQDIILIEYLTGANYVFTSQKEQSENLKKQCSYCHLEKKKLYSCKCQTVIILNYIINNNKS